MPKNVDLHEAKFELRGFPLTRSLLKQAKKLRHIPKEFLDETGADVNERCVGYVHGSVMDAEFDKILVFVHNGDLYTYNWPGYHGKAKQFYV